MADVEADMVLPDRKPEVPMQTFKGNSHEEAKTRAP